MAVAVNRYDGGSYYRVYLQGTGTITLDEVYQELYTQAGDAETYWSRTGVAGAYVYRIILQPGDLYAQFRIGSGATLQWDEGATLEHEFHPTTSSTYYTFYIDAGGTLLLADNGVYDGNPTSATYARHYWNIYGTIVGEQTAGSPFIFNRYRSMLWYFSDATPTMLDYVEFRDVTYTGGYFLQMAKDQYNGVDGASIAHSFKHITCSNGDTDSYGNVQFSYSDYSKFIFEDWTMEDYNRLYMYNNNSIKLTRFNMKNSKDYTYILNSGSARSDSSYMPSKVNSYGANEQNQPMTIFDECTFDDLDNGVYNLLTYTGSVILFKNCTTKNAQRGLYPSEAYFLLYGTTTYENLSISDRTWGSQGTFLYVRKMDLTVNDSDGNPLENAIVTMRTKLTKTVDGRSRPYEYFKFFTDENGQVKGMADDSIYLTEKEEYSLNNFYQWSDGTGDNVHIITVSHPDYATHTELIAMTEDKVRTITMSDEGGTVINESTLYDTVVY